jgi:hypothetical protein
MTNESKSCSPRPSVCVFSSPTGPLPDPRRTPSCPPDSNKRSRSAVMTDSRERAHFETPRPGPSAQENKRSWAHHLARCSKFSSLWAWSRHPEFFWGPPELSISVALHSGGHMKPPGAPEVPMDARKRKGLIGTKVRGERLQGPGARCVVQIFEKRPKSKCVFCPNMATKYDPGPTDHFDRHGLDRNMLGGRWRASRLALDFPPWAPLGSGLQGGLKNSSR